MLHETKNKQEITKTIIKINILDQLIMNLCAIYWIILSIFYKYNTCMLPKFTQRRLLDTFCVWDKILWPKNTQEGKGLF